MRLRFVMLAYGAAGVSFLASLLRDYAVIGFSDQHQHFFHLLYVASLAASFAVNAIALGTGALGRSALALLFVLGLGVLLVLAPPTQTPPATLAVLATILLLWIIGARYGRALVEHGWVFSGRVREAIASLVLAALAVAGMAMDAAFLLSVLAGTLFSWVMWRLAALPPAAGRTQTLPRARMLAFGRSVVMTNCVTFTMTYWALVLNAQPQRILGYDMPTVVRFSMYLFQILTIGSVALVATAGWKPRQRQLGRLVMVLAACFLASMLLPALAALVLVPVLAALTHYALVLYLQQDRGMRP